MKKLAAFLLAILLLTLCGCGMEPVETTPPTVAAIPTNPDGSFVVPTRPAGSSMDHSGYAMTVRMIINPDFELQLADEFIVLAVNPNNDDARTLLADLDLVGQPYDLAVTAILEAAKNKNFLKDGVGVAISVKEVSNSGDIVPATMLEKPLKAYQEQSGLTFTYQVSANNAINPDQSTRIETYTDPYGWKHTAYVQGDKTIMDTFTFDDGTVVEVYPISENSHIEIRYHTDGSYSYTQYDDSSSNGYREYPDGSRDYVYEVFLDNDGSVYSLTKNRDGSSWEAWIYCKNDRLVRVSTIYSDGTQQEATFHPNGNTAVDVYHSDAGVSTTRYDENGVITSETFEATDGTKTVNTYENGVCTGSTVTYPDGTTETQAIE